MNIRLDPADVAFSRYIRLRDGECLRCHRRGDGKDGIIGLQASHYFGRGRENTRFDVENVDSLCFGCHRQWGSDNREDYRNFKIKQLGQDAFDNLCIRAETYCKKDRKMSLIIVKQLIKELEQ